MAVKVPQTPPVLLQRPPHSVLQAAALEAATAQQRRQGAAVTALEQQQRGRRPETQPTLQAATPQAMVASCPAMEHRWGEAASSAQQRARHGLPRPRSSRGPAGKCGRGSRHAAAGWAAAAAPKPGLPAAGSSDWGSAAARPAAAQARGWTSERGSWPAASRGSPNAAPLWGCRSAARRAPAGGRLAGWRGSRLSGWPAEMVGPPPARRTRWERARVDRAEALRRRPSWSVAVQPANQPVGRLPPLPRHPPRTATAQHRRHCPGCAALSAGATSSGGMRVEIPRATSTTGAPAPADLRLPDPTPRELRGPVGRPPGRPLGRRPRPEPRHPQQAPLMAPRRSRHWHRAPALNHPVRWCASDSQARAVASGLGHLPHSAAGELGLPAAPCWLCLETEAPRWTPPWALRATQRPIALGNSTTLVSTQLPPSKVRRRWPHSSTV